MYGVNLSCHLYERHFQVPRESRVYQKKTLTNNLINKTKSGIAIINNSGMTIIIVTIETKTAFIISNEYEKFAGIS